ncbi:MAG: hypothetical protein ACMXYD_02635 [Candidatus Woesearchaeota archaeon]
MNENVSSARMRELFNQRFLFSELVKNKTVNNLDEVLGLTSNLGVSRVIEDVQKSNNEYDRVVTAHSYVFARVGPVEFGIVEAVGFRVLGQDKVYLRAPYLEPYTSRFGSTIESGYRLYDSSDKQILLRQVRTK